MRLETTDEMVADAEGLIHGGFIFGAADYAAMVAVNDPNVVLAGAEVRFSAPVRIAREVDFEAKVVSVEGRKQKVEVVGRVEDLRVFEGTFSCVVLERHVLEGPR